MKADIQANLKSADFLGKASKNLFLKFLYEY